MNQLIPIEYKEYYFPMMLEDAKERFKNNPTDYNLGMVAYWRDAIHKLKKLTENVHTGNYSKTKALTPREFKIGSC